MQSGIGPADHLQVGRHRAACTTCRASARNLQDHLDLFVDLRMHRRPHLRQLCQAAPHASGPACNTSCSGTGPVASSLFETGGFWYADPTAPLARHPVPSRPRLRHRGRRREAAQSGRDAELRLPASALARHGAARAAPTRAATPLIDPNYWADPLRPRRCRSRACAWPARSCARRRSRPSSRRERAAGTGARRRDEDLFDYACRTAKTDHHPGRHLQDGPRRDGGRRPRT